MTRNLICNLLCFSWLPLLLATSTAQTISSQSAASPPVPYTSVSQLNLLLSHLEEATQAVQADLAKLRIERWKTDSGSKRQAQANVESIQHNLQAALPEMIGELRNSPENLTATFKLYRNLDALYSVFGSVVESAGAFGSKDEFQSLQNDLSTLERSRRSFADRMESLSGAKEAELARLRSTLQKAQAAVISEPPKKVVVDDSERPKKAVKKKVKTTTPAKPATTQPPAQAQPPQ
jgi:DNA repair exonuclease SbcCD ATPase subunit